MFSQISLMKFLRKAGVKIGDVIIIGILIIPSFIPLFVFSIEKENETTEDVSNMPSFKLMARKWIASIWIRSIINS